MTTNIAETVTRIFGTKGQAWLERLPQILAQCAARWQLTLGEPVSHLSINYLAYATTRDGEAVVLKVGVPHRELETEIEALQWYAGRGMVRCLDADLELGAMLLERLRPGRMLTSVGDNARETRIAAGIMRTLTVPCPPSHHLPTFAEWVERAFVRLRRTYGPDAGPLGRRLVEQAETALADIERGKVQDVLLHGDLHHENILFDDRHGWLAIDPKGVIGDACLNVARFMHNQLPSTLSPVETAQRLTERAAIFAEELHATPQAILRATLLDKVLSLSWSLEEEGEIRDEVYEGIAEAQLLSELSEP